MDIFKAGKYVCDKLKTYHFIGLSLAPAKLRPVGVIMQIKITPASPTPLWLAALCASYQFC
jgi:hypothetical protein